MNSTTIMIIDDRPSFRALICKALSQDSNLDMKVIECELGAHGSNAVTQIAKNSPDIVLLGIRFPVFRELGIGRKIAHIFPRSRLIILSLNPEEDDDELFEVIRSGATAYLQIVRASFTELAATIKEVRSGEYPICDIVARRPKIALRIMRLFQNRAAKDGISTANFITLTPMETSVLTLITEGNRARPNKWGISEQSIKNQLKNVLNKLVENETFQDSFAEIQNSLKSYRIARDGNLFILGALLAPPCQTQLLPDGPSHS